MLVCITVTDQELLRRLLCIFMSEGKIIPAFPPMHMDITSYVKKNAR